VNTAALVKKIASFRHDRYVGEETSQDAVLAMVKGPESPTFRQFKIWQKHKASRKELAFIWT
jgi:hypothetical protein